MTRNLLLLAALLLFVQTPQALSQEVDEEAVRQEQLRRQRQAEEDRRAEQQAIRDREESIRRMNEMLNDIGRPDPRRAPGAAERRWDNERRSKFMVFNRAIPVFRQATKDLLKVVGAKGKPNKPAQVLEKSTNDILQFVKFINTSHPRFDSSEFKGFTQTELAWEALRTAENIAPHFEIIIRNQRDASSVSIAFLDVLYKLETELMRLKWITSRLN